MDIDTLSASQREALSQLQALMNGGDPDVAMNVLDSVDWDVQRAANVIFEMNSPTEAPTHTTAQMETFEVDDSSQSLLRPARNGREFRQVPPSSYSLILRPLGTILTVLAIPLRLFTSVLRFILRLLRIPFPQFAPFTWSSLSFRPLGSSTGHDARAMDPKTVAERWVRALEEETGAVCVSRSGVRGSGHVSANGNGISSGADVAGPSALASRSAAHSYDGEVDAERNLLPDFFLGGYEEFARWCEKSVKLGCVILVSDEHDDVPEFKRSTLTDPSFIKVIQDNDIIVWGGDIRDKEAWSASHKLQATTYPFVAFIALQPRRIAGSGASSTPTMTVLSRHQGPSIPSTSAPTAAQTLVTHLNEQVLPRVKPFLERIRAQARERERERALRAEQDRAFEESRKRDEERVLRRMEEERRAEEERRLYAEAEERAREEAMHAEEKRKAWEEHRMAWRRYGGRALVLREPRPGETGRGKTMRVGLRMPDGRRAVRFFGDADTMTSLYAHADSLFIPAELSEVGDPQVPLSGAAPGEEGLVEEIRQSGRTPEQWWGFKLVLAYPRKEIEWQPAKRLGDVDMLKTGGQLVVELVSHPESEKAKSKQAAAVDEEGYESEE
ncbi:uncharacterized protein LAESUDRAFT_743249 [Laetiporus sulphureus 93-53]|uniref:UBX domain-containing protein n=1 Tax=Laetiporus sulphureus 93-53 TaxID=1314785 RepID=A0A165EB13_9APHY|nr:uncharacterized protein LAESUDRAFT_743249 [Laetiporus sulphureus 93-53]KZT06631.1 hypothetical protein LAESUDRAFT_743249 [Laetiporus sulphureus 93-53]